MRLRLAAVVVCCLGLITGCGSSRLQRAVDQANLSQLNRTRDQSYILMTWDDAPKEWLLISETGGQPARYETTHSMLTFYDGRLGLGSRASILEGEDFSTLSAASAAETPAERKERYTKSAGQVREGRHWTGSGVVTTVHPSAVDYVKAGQVTYRGRPINLMAGEVYSSRDRDPFAIYEYARVVVGLDAATSILVLEYLVNLRPSAGSANRMLTVHDAGDHYALNSLTEAPPAERAVAYAAIYQELHDLTPALDAQVRALPKTSGSE